MKRRGFLSSIIALIPVSIAADKFTIEKTENTVKLQKVIENPQSVINYRNDYFVTACRIITTGWNFDGIPRYE